MAKISQNLQNTNSRCTVTLRDLTTGEGRSGLNVVLKKYPDYTTVFQGDEVPGKPGVYSFDNVPYSRYKLFTNDNIETSFDNASETGRWFGGHISEIISDLDMSNQKIIKLSPGTNLDDAVNKSQLDEKMPRSGGAFTGDVSMSGNRITGLQTNQGEQTDPADAASVGLILGASSYISHNYFNIPSKIIFVHPNFENIAGKKSNTIQGAINYAQSQNPGIENQYNIIIFPTSNSQGYIENLTLQPYINIFGIGKVLITGTVSGGNVNTWIINITFTYHGNLTLNNIKAKHCNIRVTNDDTGNILTLIGSIFINCCLLNIGLPEFNPTIISGGNNIFLNCMSNAPCNLQSTDKGTITSIESITTDFS